MHPPFQLKKKTFSDGLLCVNHWVYNGTWEETGAQLLWTFSLKEREGVWGEEPLTDEWKNLKLYLHSWRREIGVQKGQGV